MIMENRRGKFISASVIDLGQSQKIADEEKVSDEWIITLQRTSTDSYLGSSRIPVPRAIDPLRSWTIRMLSSMKRLIHGLWVVFSGRRRSFQYSYMAMKG